MTQVNIHEAKTHLSRLIEKALRGEKVVIAKRDKPLVRLEVEKPGKPASLAGAWRGLVLDEAPDCWEPEEYEESPTDPLNRPARKKRALKRGRR